VCVLCTISSDMALVEDFLERLAKLRPFSGSFVSSGEQNRLMSLKQLELVVNDDEFSVQIPFKGGITLRTADLGRFTMFLTYGRYGKVSGDKTLDIVQMRSDGPRLSFVTSDGSELSILVLLEFISPSPLYALEVPNWNWDTEWQHLLRLLLKMHHYLPGGFFIRKILIQDFHLEKRDGKYCLDENFIVGDSPQDIIEGLKSLMPMSLRDTGRLTLERVTIEGNVIYEHSTLTMPEDPTGVWTVEMLLRCHL